MRDMHRGRSWDWWIDRLEEAGHALPEFAEWEAAELPVVVRNPDPAAQAASIAAIELFSRRESWPTLSEPASQAVDLRIAHAMWLCEAWHKTKRPPQPETFSEVFRWLLVDCWKVSSVEWADAMAAADCS